MLDHTVLLVSADPARLCAWETLVAPADALPLPAPSLAAARAVLRHLRPDLLVLDAASPPAAARALRTHPHLARALLRALRTHPHLARVPLLLVWPSAAASLAGGAPDALVPDTYTRVWYGPAPLPIRALLAAPRAPDRQQPRQAPSGTEEKPTSHPAARRRPRQPRRRRTDDTR